MTERLRQGGAPSLRHRLRAPTQNTGSDPPDPTDASPTSDRITSSQAQYCGPSSMHLFRHASVLPPTAALHRSCQEVLDARPLAVQSGQPQHVVQANSVNRTGMNYGTYNTRRPGMGHGAWSQLHGLRHGSCSMLCTPSTFACSGRRTASLALPRHAPPPTPPNERRLLACAHPLCHSTTKFSTLNQGDGQDRIRYAVEYTRGTQLTVCPPAVRYCSVATQHSFSHPRYQHTQKTYPGNKAWPHV